MVEPASSGQISVALVNAALLALWPVLPGLLLGYLRQSAALRRVRVEFSLRQSETHELDRATRRYREVRIRLKTIEHKDAALGFWRCLFAANTRTASDEVIEDLQAHAEVLRETILRLQRRPLRRLKSWIRLASSKAALSRALAAHVIGFALLLAVSHIPDQPAWAGDLSSRAADAPGWYPFDGRFFYANAVAAAFAAGAAIVFYASQWAMLRRDHGCELCGFSELARRDPDEALDQPNIDETGAPDDASRAVAEWTEQSNEDWRSVFDLPSSATVDDVKDAYRRLIKQNHPDRVHGLSPALQRLAEVETQKLNAVLRQALRAVASSNADRLD